MAVVEEEEQEKRENKKQRFDEPHGSLENLPFDSVMEMEILPRLPLKSILRLELASKPLSPLIADHLRRRYGLPNAASGLFFTWPMSGTPTKNYYHALDSKLIIDGTISTLPPSDYLFIIDCCNGLILCRWVKNYQDYQSVVHYVCNPLTGQFASIPNSSFSFSNAVLAFDPRISGHYDIICICSDYVKVFSSETGSWVQKKQTASHMAMANNSYPFFFNGKIYFRSSESPFVKIFDRQGILVGRIDLPHSEMGFAKTLLGHSGGHLHFAVKVDEKMLVWILEDCDESRWVLKHSISFRCIFDAGLSTRDLALTYPQVFHPDMDVVFIQVRDKFFSYHMDNGDFTEVCTQLTMYRSVFVYSPCYSKDFDL